ncbi:MAG TPA: protein kinase, partial [Thermoanaerobaculia bacterium]|nr:protein kinase [Thermoanaerobaculia bacterium]
MKVDAGTRLGQYEVIAPIGAGGMGEVFRARDTRLGREVALKVLPSDVIHDAERLARFEREARAASALNHPNIITVHEFASEEGDAWLVMELVRGESLRELISRGPLPLRKITAIAAGIADGLAAAHGKGLIHRDLKPENVMITAEGTPKILDFGLAKGKAAVDEHAATAVRITQEGMVVGTVGYMAPEQARGEEIDFRADQFSLGVLLYEMATGRHPFRANSAVETLAAILHHDPPSLPDTLPQHFLWIVDRCLAKDAAERYGSTADLAHDLRRLRDSGERSTISGVAPRKADGTRRLIAIGAAVLTLAIAGVVVTLVRRPSSQIGHSVQGAIPTPQLAQVFRDEVALPVALSPNGDALVVYGTNADGVAVLSLHDLRSGASRQIAEHAFAAAFSPDGTAVAFFADGKLKTVPIGGGPARVLCDARPEGSPAWAGDTILYTQYSGSAPGIYRVSAGGGTPERIVTPEASGGGLPWWPEFLPDGKRFLYLTLIRRPGGQALGHELLVGFIDGRPPQRISRTIDSRAVYANGHLLFVREGTLLAQRFDLRTLQLSGETKPVVDRLHYFANTGVAAFSVSRDGLLSWRTARAASRLSWIDRAGVELRVLGTTIFRPPGRISPDGMRYATAIVDPKHGSSDIWIYDLNRESSERATFLSVDELAPVWTPGGRTLFYRGDGQGPPDILKLNLGDESGSLVHSGPGVEEPHDV